MSPAANVAHPGGDTVLSLASSAVDLLEEMLPRRAADRRQQATGERIGTVLERVVRVAARDDAPIDVVGGAALPARCPVVANCSSWSFDNVESGAHGAQADVGLVEVVRNGLVETPDLEQHIVPERAVPARDPAHPPLAVEGDPEGAELGSVECLEAVVRGRSAVELVALGVTLKDRPPGASRSRGANEGGDEIREPLRRAGERIVVDEGHDVARGRGNPDVP